MLWFILFILIVWVVVKFLNSLNKPNSNNGWSYIPAPISTVQKVEKAEVVKLKIIPFGTKWISKYEKIKVQNYQLGEGLFYVGNSLKDTYGYSADASLINPALKAIDAEPWEGSHIMGYWPKYSEIDPLCRGAYLKWLAGGRVEPRAYIGYVFLFFYGLERRVIIDRDAGLVTEGELEEISNEVVRLLKIYGENKSFYSYAQGFLSLLWIINGDTSSYPDYLDPGNRASAFGVQVALGHKVFKGIPIDASWAFRWLIAHPETSLGTAARRCPKEFETIFTHHFTNQFPDGYMLSPNKTKIKISYGTASPSIAGGITLSSSVPDVFALKKPIEILNSIGQACIQELDSYSRYLGRQTLLPSKSVLLSLLPTSLFSQDENVKRFIEELTSLTPNSDGSRVVELSKVFSILGEPSPTIFSKKDSEVLSLVFAKAGFAIAPDVSLHSIKPEIGSSIYFIPAEGLESLNPSNEYSRMLLHIRLGALVSQADNDVSGEEEQLILKSIENQNSLSILEKQSLKVFASWCLGTTQNLNGLKQKISSISLKDQKAIAHHLISIAQADGRLDNREIKQLEKLYATLGLDKQLVLSDLHHSRFSDEPVTIALPDSETGFAIPKPAPPGHFGLNEALIRQVVN